MKPASWHVALCGTGQEACLTPRRIAATGLKKKEGIWRILPIKWGYCPIHEKGGLPRQCREVPSRNLAKYRKLIFCKSLRYALTNFAGVLGPFSRKLVTPIRMS